MSNRQNGGNGMLQMGNSVPSPLGYEESCFLPNYQYPLQIIPELMLSYRNDFDLRNSMGITEDDTDLGGSCAFLSEAADLLNDLLGGGLQPGWRGTAERDGRG